MKNKNRIGLILLWTMNIGIILVAIAYDILHHQYTKLVTDAILLLVSIYFTASFLSELIYSENLKKENIVMAADLLMKSSEAALEYTKTVANYFFNPKLTLDIVCENEKYLPSYANKTDACMDLKIKIQELDCYFLRPNETATFSTGIKASIPENNVMLIFPRSSTGFKLNCMLTNTTGIIDAGYRDEIKIALTNFGTETVCLKDGQRVAQFVVIPRPQLELNLVEDNEDFRNGDRGGGIGSTGE